MRILTHDGGLSRAVLSLVEIAEVNFIELQKRGGLRFASLALHVITDKSQTEPGAKREPGWAP
jgi:hypothetical protein